MQFDQFERHRAPKVSVRMVGKPKRWCPKHKRARLTEGAKLTLEALSILKKGDVVEKLRNSPLKNKQVMDKCRADKSPLVTKASKKTKLWLELVCTC